MITTVEMIDYIIPPIFHTWCLCKNGLSVIEKIAVVATVAIVKVVVVIINIVSSYPISTNFISVRILLSISSTHTYTYLALARIFLLSKPAISLSWFWFLHLRCSKTLFRALTSNNKKLSWTITNWAVYAVVFVIKCKA